MKGSPYLVALLVLGGCEPPDNRAPEGALARVAACVDRADRRCLYHALDRDSQWSVQTIHRTLGEIGEVVRRAYPEPLRAQAFGTWQGAASEKEPSGVFADYCRRTACLDRLTGKLGAVVEKSVVGPNRVALAMTRGHPVTMTRADGRWGLDLFADALQTEKIRILDRREQVQKDAAVYEEQRLAGGDAEPTRRMP